MTVAERLDRLQRARPWASYPIAVVYKFVDDQGVYLAALITYYGFLSLFPLLLLLTAGLGFVLQRQPALQERILESAVAQFPVIGEELGRPAGLEGSGVAALVGGLIAIYGALRVAQVTHHAMDVCWAVPRHQRPNPVVARLRSLAVIAVLGVALLGSTVLAAVGRGAAQSGLDLGGLTAVLLWLASVTVNTVVFALALRLSTVQRLALRQVWPGAVFAAVCWQLLQTFGTAYVSGVVQQSGGTYGVFAVVLGLMTWIFLAAGVIVLATEINVVRVRQLYPRALLAPFTEETDLTGADERSFTDTATSTRAKEFEQVDVTFDREGEEPRGA